MIGKTFEEFLKEAGHNAKAEVNKLTGEVMYHIDGETISSNDISKSQYAGLQRRYTMISEDKPEK
ncbi:MULTISPECIES: hypothetical protein [Bacillus cereus group]|uniref:DUF4025 domain-containing protein n=1 Tax=Bacillus paranthracis TaxID=2026186 RepID=A0ABT6E2H0_9BACI|nr:MULTISPECIES: hypothetical protein [Bacillus cereus group]MDG0918392.1 hypothetical protein [Bacillus paranthracis]MDG0927691.1 hypothetical protein [Bacillus paranthracis]MDG0937471.1 hypothetical protein [Bacillus paranthracis]MDG0944567.1 hypothetical protein [Bacillus paranthracis]MDG0956703.1 hypothetical protein [Bacillus paranthracis]